MRQRRIVWGLSFCTAAGGFIWLVASLIRSEPRYEGHSLSYWLDRLKPTIVSANGHASEWPRLQYRSKAAVLEWIDRTENEHERAERALQTAGLECLPILIARITAKERPDRFGKFRDWAYRMNIIDSKPFLGESNEGVRRGQALTAIIILGDRAGTNVVNELVRLTNSEDNLVKKSASHALWSVDPEEFRRTFSPGYRARSEQELKANLSN